MNLPSPEDQKKKKKITVRIERYLGLEMPDKTEKERKVHMRIGSPSGGHGAYV